MRFQVPQFIEQEAKIAGPLTFKQFVMLVIAGFIIVMLWLLLSKVNLSLFFMLSAIILISAVFLAFMRVGGRSLPTVLGNFFFFFTSSKIYLWKKKELPPRLIWKKVEGSNGPVRPKQVVPELKAFGRSRISEMTTNIEIKK